MAKFAASIGYRIYGFWAFGFGEVQHACFDLEVVDFSPLRGSKLLEGASEHHKSGIRGCLDGVKVGVKFL
jgi:hypothetical protein